MHWSEAPIVALAAVSGRDIWGVGGGGAHASVIVHWDGRTWHQLPPLHIAHGNIIPRALSAVSANDVWMVGDKFPYYREQTLAAHWDGHQWSILPSPNSSVGNGTLLLGVTAVSNRDVWAVGVTIPRPQHTVIEHWDGVRWHLVPSPNASENDNQLRGIVALSARNIWAVGLSERPGAPALTYDRALIEHYDGVRWAVVPPRAEGDLDAVAAVSPRELWAVGMAAPQAPSAITGLIMEGDGRQWRTVAIPPTAPLAELTAVAVSPSKAVWAVGYDHHGALVLRRLPCPVGHT